MSGAKGRRSAIAAERIHFGARVHVGPDNLAHVAVNSLEMHGIARRQWGAGDKCAYEAGEAVDIQTENAILADFGDGNTLRVHLHKGKIV